MPQSTSNAPRQTGEQKIAVSEFELFESLRQGKPTKAFTGSRYAERKVSHDIYRVISARIRSSRQIDRAGNLPYTPNGNLTPQSFTNYLARKMAGQLWLRNNQPDNWKDQFDRDTRIFEAVLHRLEGEQSDGSRTITQFPLAEKLRKKQLAPLEKIEEHVYDSIVGAVHTLVMQHGDSAKEFTLSEKTLFDLRSRGLLKLSQLIQDNSDLREDIARLIGIPQDHILSTVLNVERRNSDLRTEPLEKLRDVEITQNPQILEAVKHDTEKPIDHDRVVRENKILRLEGILGLVQRKLLEAIAIYSVLGEATGYSPKIKNETFANHIARCFHEMSNKQPASINISNIYDALVVELGNGLALDDATHKRLALTNSYAELSSQFFVYSYLIRSIACASEALLAIAQLSVYIDRLSTGGDVNEKQLKAIENIAEDISYAVAETLDQLDPSADKASSKRVVIDTNSQWKIIDHYEENIVGIQKLPRSVIREMSLTYMLPEALIERIASGNFYGCKLDATVPTLKYSRQAELYNNVYGFSQIGRFDPFASGMGKVTLILETFLPVLSELHTAVLDTIQQMKVTGVSAFSYMRPSIAFFNPEVIGGGVFNVRNGNEPIARSLSVNLRS